MASRQIATILSLRDRISNPLVRVSHNVQNVSRGMQRAQNQVRRWGRTTTRTVDKMVKNTAKAATAMVGVVGGLAIKAGFSEAFDMEGYKVQLETAVKDTKKAGILMADAVKFANKTPFETGEVVGSVAKMEAYGLSSKRWLADIADMAGGTNKSIDQATEAMADAVMGEWERLKEFGIKKNDLMLAAEEKYGADVVFNKKGQVVDQIKMEEILQATMQKKFKGGANKLAGTAKGLWSTITGVTKSSLAKIVGMQEDGTIKQGSLHMQLKDKIKQAADQLQKWQQDGTFEKIGKQVTETVNKIIKTAKGIYNFVKKHKEVIKFILVIAGTIYTVVKAISIAKTVLMALNTVWLILNGTLALSPLGWIIIAVVALVAAGYLLYKNWDKIKAKAAELWEGIKLAFAPIKKYFSDIWDNVTSGFKSFINFLITGVNLVIRGINKLDFQVPEWIPVIGGKEVGVNIPEIPTFARGGIATKPSIFGEAGPEMAIPLKRTKRSQGLINLANRFVGNKSDNNTPINKITNTINKITDINRPAVGSKSDNNTPINKADDKNPPLVVNIYGNVYGEDDLINKLGNAILLKTKKQLGNVTMT